MASGLQDGLKCSAGVQPVCRAQVLSAAIGDGLRLLATTRKARAGRSSDAVDEEDLVSREGAAQTGDGALVVRLRLRLVLRQRRIRPTDDSRDG
jgi:hypothetical protein